MSLRVDADLALKVLGELPAAWLLVDEHGRVRAANRKAERLFRATPGGLADVRLRVLFPSEAGEVPLERRGGAELVGQRRDGERFPAGVRARRLEAPHEELLSVVVHDLTQHKLLHAELQERVERDALTGLFNRHFFDTALAEAELRLQFPVSVLIVDVDDLKVVNDTFGHVAGDALLRRAGAVFRSAFRDLDLVARIGGDEFAVLLPRCDAVARKQAIARLVEGVERVAETHPAPPLSVSIGGATAARADALAAAVERADARMYAHKADRRRGRSQSA